MKHKIYISLAGALFAFGIPMLLAGCSGGNDTFSPAVKNTGNLGGPTPPVLHPNFTLTGTPPVSISQGDSIGIPLTLKAVDGFSSPVTLTSSALPTGTTALLAPADAVTPTTAGTTVKLTLSTSNSLVNNYINEANGITTPTGTYPMTASATGGGKTHTINFNLVVTGLTVAVQTDVLELNAGQSVTYNVTVTPVNGFTGIASLSTKKLDADVAAAFTPATLNFADGKPHTTALKLTLPAASLQSHATVFMVIAGTAGGKSTFFGTGLVSLNPPGTVIGVVK